jgi:hypothetical protein
MTAFMETPMAGVPEPSAVPTKELAPENLGRAPACQPLEALGAANGCRKIRIEISLLGPMQKMKKGVGIGARLLLYAAPTRRAARF